jgi:hypothetical protein
MMTCRVLLIGYKGLICINVGVGGRGRYLLTGLFVSLSV